MPIEIRELVVKAIVAPTGSKDGAQEYPTGGNNHTKETVINECVERVLEIIKEKEER